MNIFHRAIWRFISILLSQPDFRRPSIAWCLGHNEHQREDHRKSPPSWTDRTLYSHLEKITNTSPNAQQNATKKGKANSLLSSGPPRGSKPPLLTTATGSVVSWKSQQKEWQIFWPLLLCTSALIQPDLAICICTPTPGNLSFSNFSQLNLHR